MNKSLDSLNVPPNCSGICVPLLNEAEAKNRKIMSFHKRADKRLSDVQKVLIFAQNKSRPPKIRKVMGDTVDSITLMVRAQKQISAELKKH